MKPEEAAYIAGIVDGEGSITVNKSGKAYRSSLTIASTSEELLLWIQRVTDVGQICVKYTDPFRHKKAWTWAVWSNEAADLLTQLIPYLIIKKEHAKNLIQFQAEGTGKMGVPISNVRKAVQERFREISQQLNSRGVK